LDVKKTGLSGDPIAIFNCLTAYCAPLNRARLFSEVHSRRMSGFGHRLEQGNFRTDTRNFLP